MAIGIVVVKQYERMVVLKWGALNRVSEAGLRVVIPIVETGRIVDLRERVRRVPTQKYITSDNVVVDMDFVIYFRIIAEEAEKAVLNVENVENAVINLAVANLRAVIGSTSLAEALAERERITNTLQVQLDAETGRWGVKTTQIAINEIDPPPGVKSAMEREKSAAAIKTADITESEGQRQAEINRAEGDKQASILKAEGGRQAEILEAEGDQQAAVLRAEGFSSALDKIFQVANTVDAKTMSLQYFETLKSLGSSPSTKFIFPMEFTSMLQPFLSLGGQRNQPGDNQSSQLGVMDTVRKNYPELPPTRAPHFHSVRAGNLLFLSGATARDTEAAFSDIRAQTDVIYKRIKFILEAEGGSVDNVVKVTHFVTEIDEAASKAVYETRQKYFGEKVPASTRVQVVGLVDPNLKIEIEAIAVLPD